MDRIFDKLKAHGLKPAHMPSAIDLRPGGKCIRCRTCDAFPCQVDAKGDAEMCLINPALTHLNVTLQTDSLATRFITDDSGKRIVAVDVDRGGDTQRIFARLFILSAGAINSAALLLRSANVKNPNGLANSSGMVGRHFMNHNCTAFMSLMPFGVNDTRFPKTVTVNDYYFGGGAERWPLGNLQMLGKIQEPMLRGAIPQVPRFIRTQLARHSVDWYVISADLPDPESTVRPRPDGSIELNWRRTNLKPHWRFVEVAKRLLKDIGFPIVLARPFGEDTPSHQCGTARFGDDPATSALDPYCRAWDHDNLFLIDASFFPSSAALNPALTIAAQSLRAAQHIKQHLQEF